MFFSKLMRPVLFLSRILPVFAALSTIVLLTGFAQVPVCATAGSAALGGGVFATDVGGMYAAANGPEGVAAVVDGHRILLRDVQAICLRKNRAPIIDQMVQNAVLEQACTRAGIRVTAAEIAVGVEDLRRSVAPISLEEVMARHHSSLPEVQAAFKHKIQRVRLVAGQVPSVKMVHCRAILIRFSPPGAPPSVARTRRTEETARARMLEVQSQLADGKNLDGLAAKYSEAVPKAPMGDVGILYTGIHDIDPAVVSAALVLDKGGATEPVRTTEGFWILRAVSTSGAPAKSDAAAYRAARDRYVEEQSQFISPQFIVGLMDKAHLKFATDADCDPPSGTPLPEAAATVDGQIIPMPEVAAKCLAENGPRTVDILAQNYLVDAECRRRGIVVPESEIDARLAKLRRLIAPQTLEAGLEARHMTLEELRSGFRQDRERILLVAGQVKPPVMTHCRVISVKFQQQGPVTVAGVQARPQSEALLLLQDIQARLRQGKDFGGLASRTSEWEPKTERGDIGILSPGMRDMDTGVLTAGLALGAGAVSQPVRSAGAYSLVQCVSTSADHPKEEEAAYTAALTSYREQESQALVPQSLVSLIKKSRVVYYVHS